MALGKKNNSSTKKYLYLKLKRKAINKETGKEEEIFPNAFEVTEKIDGEYVVRENLETNVSGDLVKVELGTGEWQGQEYRTAKFHLEDKQTEEIYVLDLRSTGLSRSLFASLLALDTFEGIEISNYTTVSKKNGNTYANISVWQDGKLVKSKIPLEDIPKPDEIKDKKGVVVKRDYEEVDTFFWNLLTEFSKKVAKGSPAKTEAKEQPLEENKSEQKPEVKVTKTTKKKAAEAPPAPQENLDEDVPFN